MAWIWVAGTALIAFISFWTGVFVAGTANANRISELEDEIHQSIPISVIEDFIDGAEYGLCFGTSVLSDLWDVVESWK